MIPFTRDEANEVENIIKALIPETQVAVIVMSAPMINYFNHIIVAESKTYNPVHGIFEMIQNYVIVHDAKHVQRGLRTIGIIVGLYGYYPEQSIARIGIKIM